MRNWLKLGFGSFDEIIEKLPLGKWVLIRDDDAATAGANPYYAKIGNIKELQDEYENDGGTVSYITEVEKH